MNRSSRAGPEPPLPIDTLGNVATYEKGKTNVAFRFGVAQGDKLRAFDDLRRNCVNLRRTVWTPIKLPTWGHISQMRLGIRGRRTKWAFVKADHEAAYKMLPMAPGHANLALIALRNPTSGLRMACPPKALVFGAASAVLQYNCFSRLISVILNKIFGAPCWPILTTSGLSPPQTYAIRHWPPSRAFARPSVSSLKPPRPNWERA